MPRSWPERRRKMVEGGRPRMEAYFKTSRMAADTLVVYKRLTSGDVLEVDACEVCA
jgi:hypothetical protein